MTPRTAWKALLWGVCTSAAVALVAALAGVFAKSEEGPRPIVWDREVCAECGMHIGDPAYAAQIQTQAGEVLNFDDPGCLLLYVAHEHPSVRAMYFHEYAGDRWLARGEVTFVERPRDQTPMGWGLAAAARDHTPELSFEQATAYVLQRAPREQP